MEQNIEFLKTRLAEHKQCYELAIDADDAQQMKHHAGEMKNIKEMMTRLGGDV